MRRKGSKRSKDPVKRKREMERYSVDVHGDIVDRHRAVLYYAHDLKGFSHEARARLASLHSGNADIDFEHAEAVLIAEALIPESEA